MVGRLLLGKFNDGSTYGARLSVPGVEVLTAAQASLIFSTEWAGSLAVHAAGITTIGSTVAFPSMGFIPLVMALHVNTSVGACFGVPFWTQNNPDTRRVANNYETRTASGCMFTVTTSSVTFAAAKSGFTSHYSSVKYLIFRIPGT